ncbi:GMC oxidoreductase [Streptomyces sp. MZ04]|uniref:GMC family oxidoreductase n=1 Tax=Streptomyces sp. MZ04 TaxID=2559236 RepID=UPI001432CD9A|nr:GMC oxidoreductase [Streptomyces sp. MZ04]
MLLLKDDLAGPGRNSRSGTCQTLPHRRLGNLLTRRMISQPDGTFPRAVCLLKRCTNSEAVLTVRSCRPDAVFNNGVAITSGLRVDAHTQIQVARYGPGSNLMSLMNVLPLVDPLPGRSRLAQGLAAAVRHWHNLPGLPRPRRWAEQSLLLLAMQDTDNSLTLHGRRGPFGHRLTSRQGEPPSPAWLPQLHTLARRLAEQVDGAAFDVPGNWLNRPSTGHLVGGCVMAACPADGVVDPYHRVFGHPGLHVIDGSVLPANPGTNPALTITALAERATAHWPSAGTCDPRPPLAGTDHP